MEPQLGLLGAKEPAVKPRKIPVSPVRGAARGAGPCGIPENTGIPGLDSNTDTGIFENKIPVFFGIFV